MELLNYFLNLTTSGKLVVIAGVLFMALFVYYYLPSKEEDQAPVTIKKKTRAADHQEQKKKHHFFSRKKDHDKNAEKQPATQKTEATAHEKKRLFSFFRREKHGPRTEPKLDPENLNNTLDILANERADLKDFTHPRATDHFKVEVEPNSTNPKDLRKLLKEELSNNQADELNGIFSTMVQAGAINGKTHLVTNFEHQYLEKLRIWFGYRYHIYCQVSVGSVLGINADVSDLSMKQRMRFAQKCHNMSFDFMLIDKDTDRIRCAIELDDPTHNRPDREARDKRLDMVCMAAQIPLFHITDVYQKPNVCALETQELRRMSAAARRASA